MRTTFRFRRSATTANAPAALARRHVAGPLLLLGGSVLLLVLVGVLATTVGVDPRSLEQAPVAVPRVVARGLPVEAPQCQALEETTAQVHAHMERGELAAAVVLSSRNLRQAPPTTCGAVHAELARLWYAADVESLLATPPKDEPLGRQAATRWSDIEHRADQLAIPAENRRLPITVARNAYDRGLWQLADAAFRAAWRGGEVGLASIEFRHALLRNWGHELATGDNVGGREQGLGLLATAHAISRVHGLATNVACSDMRALGVADCAGALPDPGEPTLRG